MEPQEGRPGAWRGMVGLHDAPRVSGVAHVPRFRDRPGSYGKAPGAWDKGATHVFMSCMLLYGKHTDPPPIFTLRIYLPVTVRTRCACVAGLGDRKLAGWQYV